MKTTISFIADEKIGTYVDEIVSRVQLSRIRDVTGKKLKKGEILSALLGCFYSLENTEFERLFAIGLSACDIEVLWKEQTQAQKKDLTSLTWLSRSVPQGATNSDT